MAYRILIADDSAAIRDVLREALVDEGYDVSEAASGDDVLAEFNGNGAPKPDLVLMDIRMPGKDGIEVLRALRASREAELPIIVMTAFGSASTAIEAMKLGAFDYIAKPFELEEVTVAIERFFERQDLSDRVVRLLVESNRDEILIGDSPAMQDIYKIVGRVARSDATVLVSGETGTGKELAARAIHAGSARAAGPFVALNCAAITESLLENELFGHARGAFTGAAATRAGLIEHAAGGTLFLDEIGTMGRPLQAKLLRTLESGEVRRIGENNSRTVDVRFVAATNVELAGAMQSGEFREDLYYRINVHRVHMPALRERSEDIPLLIEHFLGRYGRTPSVTSCSPAAMTILTAHPYPGNVRELEHVIQRAVAVARSSELEPDDLPDELRAARPMPAGVDGTVAAARERAEREMIVVTLGRNRGEITAAARELQVSRTTMWRLMKKHGIDG